MKPLSIKLPANVEVAFKSLREVGFIRIKEYNDIRFIKKIIKNDDEIMLYCPLTAACALLKNTIHKTGSYHTAGKELGLDDDTAMKIAHASDYPNDENFSWLLNLIDGDTTC